MFNATLILTFLSIDGIGRKTVNELIKYKLPTKLEPSDVLGFLHESKIKRVQDVEIDDVINAKNKCKNIIKKCIKENIKIITVLDKEFPGTLKTIKNNPVLLYYKGNLDCIKNNKSVALIGSRNPSSKSKKKAFELGEILSDENFIVISGLALGCDTFAHKGALNKKGYTVAVMPCGLDKVYPKTNKKLLSEILKSGGCVISEYAPNSNIYKNQFIERDRLQSGLSLGVIVVETTENGGSMHTVNFAIQQNKLVGCCKCDENNHLIKNKNIYSINNLKSLQKFLEMTKEKENYIIEKYTQMTFKM